MTAAALWTAAQAAVATGGRSQDNASWAASGLSIDSRTVAPGDLFIALAGPQFDGHNFVAAALKAGAAAAMVHRRPEGLGDDAPLLEVDDTLKALWRLGRAARARTKARYLGITGSAGKTGTKEALRHCLAEQAMTAANPASFNNHWGLPLSLARMDPATVYGVFELGMNNPGEIRDLSGLLRPDIAIITNVEPAHIGNFKSLFDIADAKSEIFEPMADDGVAILFRDHALYHHLRDRAEQAGVGRIIGFGRHHDAEVRLLDCKLEAECSLLRVALAGREYGYRLGTPGQHWATNSLAVVAAVHVLGADLEAACEAMASLRPLKGRGARETITLPGGSFELIDDSYNANPASMRAAFQLLAQSRPKSGRRVAILGDMLELGQEAEAMHRRLAAPLREAADLVFACGPQMSALYEALPAAMRGAHAADSSALCPLVTGAVRPGDVLLVKGSLGSRMRTIIEVLQGLDQPPAQAANGF